MISLRKSYEQASKWWNGYTNSETPIQRKKMVGVVALSIAFGWAGVAISRNESFQNFTSTYIKEPLLQVLERD